MNDASRAPVVPPEGQVDTVTVGRGVDPPVGDIPVARGRFTDAAAHPTRRRRATRRRSSTFAGALGCVVQRDLLRCARRPA